jgi:glycosyltransferase involved in cell wall biosynthesis
MNTRPVRVLHVLPHRGGGAETYIDMLERMPGFSHARFYLSAGRTPASALTSLPLRWPRLAAGLGGADIIHCHGDMASVIALPLLRRRPSVMTCQGLHMVRRLQGARRAAMERALAAVSASAQAMICSSRDERDDLASMVRAPDLLKLHVIANGIDPPAQLDEQARTRLREELGVTPGTALGLFVGQLEARKAPVLAARAAQRVHDSGAPFVLAVAGDGPEAPRLRALAGEAVRILGHRSDVPRLLSAGDVFLQPSEREGMSFALLEAMSHGLAVVAADSSSNPEAVDDAGLLFAGGDEDALVQALLRLAGDPELRATLGARARDRARAHFSPAGFVSASEAIYRRALEAYGSARALESYGA